MSDIETREWEQVRAQGRDRFVLREGILKRGLRDASILAALWAVVHIFKHEPIPAFWDLWASIATFCLVTLGAGWVEGVQLWERRETEYQEYLKSSHMA